MLNLITHSLTHSVFYCWFPHWSCDRCISVVLINCRVMATFVTMRSWTRHRTCSSSTSTALTSLSEASVC